MPNLDPQKMTQPMGPLERGDQAVVDALHRLPEHSGQGRATELTAHDPDGSTTWMARGSFANEDLVTGHIKHRDEGSETVTAVVDPTRGGDAISISMGDSYAGSSPDVVHVSGNEVEAHRVKVTDRAQAQALKLEAAGRLDTMREHVGEASIKGAQQ